VGKELVLGLLSELCQILLCWHQGVLGLFVQQKGFAEVVQATWLEGIPEG
jgi:hypothetical protein